VVGNISYFITLDMKGKISRKDTGPYPDKTWRRLFPGVVHGPVTSEAGNFAAKDKIDGTQKAECGPQIVEFQGLFHIDDGKRDEDRKGNDLLENLQLSDGEDLIADTVGGNLEHIFKKGNPPADQGRHHPGFVAEFPEMGIPGKGHKDIAEAEQDDGEEYGAHGSGRFHGA
jgi:hypothetical protein